MSEKQRLLAKNLVVSLLFFCAILIVTAAGIRFGTIANATTVAFGFLIIIVASSIFGGLFVAVVTSILATLCFNYFFLPPVGTFRIADFHNWISLCAFLLTATVISHFTASAHENAKKAEVLDQTVRGLKELGSFLLSIPHERVDISRVAQEISRIFSFEYCSIHVHADGKWHHFSGSPLQNQFQQVVETLDRADDHPAGIMGLMDARALGFRYSQLIRQTRTTAILVVKTDYISDPAIATVASMIGVLLSDTLDHQRSFSAGLNH
jgi:K+-sensing histidine kinase KdpD